jgi:hypothetical protein
VVSQVSSGPAGLIRSQRIGRFSSIAAVRSALTWERMMANGFPVDRGHSGATLVRIGGRLGPSVTEERPGWRAKSPPLCRDTAAAPIIRPEALS